MTLGAFLMYRAIIRDRPKIAHFHDPELLPWAVLLEVSGIKTIYDAHEDLPAAIMSKEYIPRPFRRLIAFIVGGVELILAARLTAVIAATPSIAENFRNLRPSIIQNFPLLAELQTKPVRSDETLPSRFAYVGGITKIRSAIEMVEAIDLVPDLEARLEIAGAGSPKLLTALKSMPGWKRVEAHGWADRATVAKILSRSRAGLVLFHPEPNHLRAQPNKLFEYMAAGLPVIASNFPLWREIIEDIDCGLLVDPEDPKAIADAMQWILDNPEEAARMGRRGRISVEEQFNWESEGQKLVSLYMQLAPQADHGA